MVRSRANIQNLDRRGFVTGLAAGAGSVALLGASGPAWAACPVGEQSLNPNGWRIFRAANPPRSNAASTISGFTSWPCTDAVDSGWGATTSTWTGGGPLNNWPVNAWYFVWANRAASPRQTISPPNPLQSPAIVNPKSGNTCRVNYTTIARANAATRCLVRYWLGRSDYMEPWLRLAGTSAQDFVTYSQLSQNPSAYFTTAFKVANARETVTYDVMTDRPWLPSAPVTKTNPNGLYQRAFMMPGAAKYQNAPGIVLDYEVADGRSTGVGASANDPDGALNFIKSIYEDIHATADTRGLPQAPAKLVLYTDPLNGPSMTHSGLDATNLFQICRNHVDLMSIMLFGGNKEGSIPASYSDQIGVLQSGALKAGGSASIPYDKLFLTFDVAGSQPGDAAFAHNLLMQNGAPKAVWFWNDGAIDCSGAANAQIAAVLQGSGARLASLS